MRALEQFWNMPLSMGDLIIFAVAFSLTGAVIRGIWGDR
jgi:hypothetical protein